MCVPHGSIRLKNVFLFINKYAGEDFRCDLQIAHLSRSISTENSNSNDSHPPLPPHTYTLDPILEGFSRNNA